MLEFLLLTLTQHFKINDDDDDDDVPFEIKCTNTADSIGEKLYSL